ncbi:hypothetical protein EUX98_g5771 [Antrodiella citrinella]|uniref:DH domain-containing protein n=1 Tax=Antrodiella citrinella TaxID=2447956 RepID=A0A4S4MYD1_9APHY|nr:hypothetical protein EUX98_g5771 [Antrodiella citrinella]
MKNLDSREVKSEGDHSSPLDRSDSLASFKTARSTVSPPTSPPVRSPPTKKVFHISGSVSEGENSDDEASRGRQVEREIAANVEEVRRLKRFHTFVELLKTEVGYLMDLRALVTIYLAQLPHVSVNAPLLSARPSPSSISISSLGLTRSFPSSRSSFIAVPQVSGAASGQPSVISPDFLSASARVDADAPRDSGKLHPDSGRDAKKTQDIRRTLLSESDMQLVSRNSLELLKLHEGFVRELRETVTPLGYGAVFARLDDPIGEEGDVDYWAASDMVDVAVNVTADVFVRQASSFGIYELFCAKHNEAGDIVRNAQDQYAAEWDGFEQLCSLLVAHAFELPAHPQSAMDDPEAGDQSSESLKRARRHSTPILTAAPPSSFTMSARPPTEYAETRKRKRSGDSPFTSQVGRLKFMDFMIKPVQRICKYPLLLDQLKSSCADDAVGAVDRACTDMRSVVGLVDMASMKQAHSVKSALIVSRIAPSLPAQPPRSASPSSPAILGAEERPSSLTAEFLTSLGACLLSGALDIVQHPSSRARYLGSFLYVGGYMVMVKITKGGKVYEPKYWFSLSGFELIEDEEEDATFPYSFQLCGYGHYLQFAASCQMEKEIWMAAIQDAMSTAPEWKNEPQSSLPDAIAATSPTEEEHHEFTATPLPTIQSLSEFEGSDAVVPPSATRSQSRPQKTTSRVDSVLRHDGQTSTLALSRRSSTASVKAFFAPLSFDMSSRIARPSSQVRQQVDHALHDVFSDNCLTIRSRHACAQPCSPRLPVTFVQLLIRDLIQRT